MNELNEWGQRSADGTYSHEQLRRAHSAFTPIELLVAVAVSAMPLSAAEPRPGSVDLSFDAGELNGLVPQTGVHTVVEDIALLPDGRIYIGGHLNLIRGLPRDGIARLLPNGLLDATFREHAAEFSLRHDTHRLFLQNDGKLLAGYDCVRRFYPDGTGDSSLTNCPNVIAVLPEGKLLALPADSPSIPFRLNSDGTRDPSFFTPVKIGGAVLIEPDRRIILQAEAGLVRLLPDGEIDASFQAVGLGGAFVSALARQPAGRYLIGGGFTVVNGVPRSGVARLLSDGRLDASFDAAETFLLIGESDSFDINRDTVRALAIQPDGKVFVGGHFLNPKSASSGGLVRLNPSGSLDVSFDIGTGARSRNTAGPGFVNRIVLQSDGRILVGGEFTEFGGVPRSYIVRLNGDSPLLRLGSPERLPDGTFRISVADFTGRTTVVEAATELSPPNWQPIWTNAVSSGSFTVIDPGGSGSPRRFYRALAR